MKRSLLFLLIFVASFSVHASVPVFTLGTNNFSLVFQDTSLPEGITTIIAEDIVRLVTAAWTNAPVVFSGPTAGKILFRSLGNPPFAKLGSLPSHFNSADTNGVLLLEVETSLSNDYLDAIQTLNSFPEQVSAARQFFEFIRSGSLAQISEEETFQYFFMEGLDENGYRSAHNGWLAETQSMTFFSPSILSFELDENITEGTGPSLTMQIPIQTTDGNVVRNSSIPALWKDGRWKLYIIAW